MSAGPVDDARLAAILGEPVISEQQLAAEAAEIVSDARRRGANLTEEQAREMVLGPLRRMRAERHATERAAAWAQQVAEGLPRTSGRLNDRTGIPMREVMGSKPDDVPTLKAIEALNGLITTGQAVMRGTADYAVLARKS